MKRIIALYAVLAMSGLLGTGCKHGKAADSTAPDNKVDTLAAYVGTTPESADDEIVGKKASDEITPEEPDVKDGLFIVVAKNEMTLTVYDFHSHPIKTFPVCCGAELGDKQTVVDLRTPEGVFKVKSVEVSKFWRERFEDGTVSRPGAYGPYFIRLEYPPYHHIGIHGTYTPESIGHRASHGCVRLRNEDVCELRKFVYKDMPVVITPSLDDTKANGRFLLDGGVSDRITVKR